MIRALKVDVTHNQDELEKFFDQISGWMCKDIQVMIDGGANYPAALCVLVYAEALGRIGKGTLLDADASKGLPAFQYFLEYMGYSSQNSEVIYKKLRHGMAHSYIPNWKTDFIMEGGEEGFEIRNKDNVVVRVKKAFEEFKSAIPKVKSDISKPEVAAPIICNLKRLPQFSGETSFTITLASSSGETSSVNQNQA